MHDSGGYAVAAATGDSREVVTAMRNRTERATPGPQWADDLVGDASNILVKAPCFGGGKTRACVDLLGTTTPADVSALVVTCGYPVEQWLSLLRDNASRPPENLVLIATGDTTGESSSGRIDAECTRPLAPGTPVVDCVGDPADFTGIGIKVSEYLRAFQDARYDGGPHTLTLCIDSLTALLQYAPTERVYRFLDAITDWARRSGATAHYHLDPQAHDRRDIARLEPLFDAAIDATPAPDPADWHITRTP